MELVDHVFKMILNIKLKLCNFVNWVRFIVIFTLKVLVLEFGDFKGELLLGDEFTPDGCRVWDAETREKLDKDRFRQGLGDVVESYQIMAKKLGVI